jgi:hypothetical protein
VKTLKNVIEKLMKAMGDKYDQEQSFTEKDLVMGDYNKRHSLQDELEGD